MGPTPDTTTEYMGPTPDTTIEDMGPTLVTTTEYMGPSLVTTTEDMGPTPDTDNTNNSQPNISESSQIIYSVLTSYFNSLCPSFQV